MLAGDDKALFENCFGQQGQQLLLHEEVVYVPRAQLGGPGSALHCGFPLDGEDAVVCRPCPVEEEALDDAPGSEWVKELMIHGTGRSNWGSFRFRGRVRAFDGLMTLLKEYASDVPSPAQATRGNWLYRGYVTADSRLVGTWRDTFSPEDVSGASPPPFVCSSPPSTDPSPPLPLLPAGYEGPFSLRKQSDAYLLPDVTSIKPDTSLASFVETMRSNMGEPVPTALPPQTASLTTAAVFASTAADVLETLNKLKPDEADRSGAAAAAVSEGRKQRLLEAKLSTPNSPAALSPVAREPSADGRLPFIYPGFTREESERWDEHKARIHDSWGTAVYNEIKVAFDSAGHTSTRDRAFASPALTPASEGLDVLTAKDFAIPDSASHHRHEPQARAPGRRIHLNRRCCRRAVLPTCRCRCRLSQAQGILAGRRGREPLKGRRQAA